ncbi:MAG: substrate-binding domain-containing protein, partial [Anaerotignaceae bacterium]
MKKIVGLLMAVTAVAAMFAGCASSQASTPTTTETTTTETTTQAPAETSAEAFSGSISVITREDGSGTRGAFVEITGVEQKNDAGEKVDMTTLEAIVANSTSIVMTSVAGDKNAVGYISLGSLNDSVKALEINGVEATGENVKSGDYKVARPFNIVKSSSASEAADDFINFILSAEGQAVVESSGYISAENKGAYASNGASGKVVVAGSSSVTPV